MSLREGQQASFPPDVSLHLVAAAYGQSPAQVRRWPADDFLKACALLEIVR